MKASLPALTAGLLLLLVVTGVLAHGPAIVDGYFASDSLYGVALYRDLFVDHFDVRAWNLTPAPYFFPDLALLFLLLPILPLGHVFIAYTLVWLFLTLAAFALLAEQVLGDRRRAALASAAVGALLIAVLPRPPYDHLGLFVLSPTAHAGAFCIGLFLCWLFVRAAARGYTRRTASAFVALATATVVSDALLIPWFIAPLCLAALLLWWRKWLSKDTAVLTVALALGSTAFALGLKRLLMAAEVLRWSIPLGVDPNFGTFFETLGNFHIIGGYVTLPFSFPALGLSIATAIALCVVFYVQQRSAANDDRAAPDARKRAMGIVLIVGVLSLVGAVLGPLSKGQDSFWFVRYLHPIILFPTFLGALLLAALRGRWARGLQIAALVSVAGFNLYETTPKLAGLDASALDDPYPSSVACMDRIAVKHDLEWGYCGYFENKYVTQLSKANVRANPAPGQIFPWYFSSNHEWYAKRPGGERVWAPKYEFAAMQDVLVPEVQARFGTAAEVIPCGFFSVLLYNRKRDVAFRNRIRIPAVLGRGPALDENDYVIPGKTAMPTLPAAGEHESNIACAEEHRIYTPDQLNDETIGLVVVPNGRQIRRGFGGTVTADVLEIAADGNSTYSVELFRGDTLVAELSVARGVTPEFEIRHELLPEAATREPFDRIVVAPDSDHPAHVGHICVYDDSF